MLLRSLQHMLQSIWDYFVLLYHFLLTIMHYTGALATVTETGPFVSEAEPYGHGWRVLLDSQSGNYVYVQEYAVVGVESESIP